MTILPCFVCKRKLLPVFPDRNEQNQPYDAAIFKSYGQYGSTAFDPMDGSFIVINVCDDCLQSNADIVLCYRRVQPNPVVWKELEVEDGL